VRTVYVFPDEEQGAVRALLDTRSPAQNAPWYIDDCLYVRLEAEPDELYVDWEVDDVRSLVSGLGRLPTWAIVIDVSGRVLARDEVRNLVMQILSAGGVAMDDYSDHPWTFAEIVADSTVDRRSFFLA
jgi:hypothetical protein